MHRAQLDVGGFVFGQCQHFFTVGDFGGASHHGPMHGTAVVFLQAQGCLGRDMDALDLEACAFVDTVLPAPKAVHFSMQGVFFLVLWSQ